MCNKIKYWGLYALLGMYLFFVGCAQSPQRSNTADFADWQQFYHNDYLTQQDRAAGYRLEKVLLNQQSLLSDEEHKRLSFLSEYTLYKSAITERKRRLAESIELETTAVEEYYQQLRETFPRPEKIRLYQIYKRFEADSDVQSRKLLKQEMLDIRDKISNLDDFKALAEMTSDSQTRLKKGLIGNVPPGYLQPDLEQAAFALSAGEMSPIIEGAQGLMLLYCEKKIPQKSKTEAQLREMAQDQLKNRMFSQQWHSLQAQLIEQQNIQINWQYFQTPHASQATLIQGQNFSLTQQQVLWLLKQASARDISKERIRMLSEQYAFSVSAYKGLDVKKQDALKTANLFVYQSEVAAAVLQKLVNKAQITATEQQIKDYFDRYADKYTVPPRFELSGIALQLTPDNRQEQYKKAFNMYDQLHTDFGLFGRLSNSESIYKDKFEKGYMGWFEQPELNKKIGLNVLKQVLILSPSQPISKPVETDNGLLWLIQLHQQQPRRQMSYQEAKTRVDKDVINMLRQANKKRIISELLENDPIH
ncbi:peptidylprolyl isomerase [Marinicella sp. W31]|uniref:peptidylprolyl isomerase n=1 Tax=Marinicella sp. W31 TaxID=3023713 RepID=UPI0037582389